jgi:hypothetical protein
MRTSKPDQRTSIIAIPSRALYQATNWPHRRRVIVKAGVLAKGTNTRFVVTTTAD